MKNLANNFGSFIVDHPKVFIRFRVLVAIDWIRKMFARLPLCLENRTDLFTRIPGVLVTKSVLECKQLIF